MRRVQAEDRRTRKRQASCRRRRTRRFEVSCEKRAGDRRSHQLRQQRGERLYGGEEELFTHVVTATGRKNCSRSQDDHSRSGANLRQSWDRPRDRSPHVVRSPLLNTGRLHDRAASADHRARPARWSYPGELPSKHQSSLRRGDGLPAPARTRCPFSTSIPAAGQIVGETARGFVKTPLPCSLPPWSGSGASLHRCAGTGAGSLSSTIK